MVMILVCHWISVPNWVGRGVPDLWHFGTDPVLIHDYISWSFSFRHWLSRCQQNSSFFQPFLLISFFRWIYIKTLEILVYLNCCNHCFLSGSTGSTCFLASQIRNTSQRYGSRSASWSPPSLPHEVGCEFIMYRTTPHPSPHPYRTVKKLTAIYKVHKIGLRSIKIK